jgi:hypothetical protein
LIDFRNLFLLVRRAELARLARFTDQPLEELEQEAWMIAAEMQSLQVQPLDFSNAEVQAEILKTLKRWFERLKRQSRRHTSLDQSRGSADGDGTWSLADLIPAEEHSDPLRALLRSENWRLLVDQFIQISRRTYSQFSAYLILIAHFEGERQGAAEYLAIAPATFDSRMTRAKASLNVQSSFFDGLVFLGLDFWPPPGRRKAPSPVYGSQDSGEQLALFETDGPVMVA